MSKFTNKNMKKEIRNMRKKLIVFILVIVIAFGFKIWEDSTIEEVNNNITDLNSIIISSEDKTDKKAYINLNMIPYQFAVSDDTENSFFIVADDQYLYIAYMSPSDFERLNNEDIVNNPVRIEGITETTTEQIKELAIDTYNEGLEEDEQISIDEFNNYFGSVYLNMTIEGNSNANILLCLFILFLLFGVIGTISSLIQLISFKKKTSKMDSDLIEELDNEMNDEKSFYYEKIHLYLTDKHIINFDGKFTVIDYKDIVWMYPFEQRTNGIKTSQAIKVMTEDGKTYTIATIDVVSKAKKEIYNEIWNTIISKNNKMLLGYTKENIQEMKEKKKNKKNEL